MNTKHTPGPQKHIARASAELTAELDTLLNTESDTLGGASVRACAARADGAARQIFASITGSVCMSVDEWQSHLDERAKMLAALRAMLSCEYGTPEAHAAVRAARAALAKANGT